MPYYVIKLKKIIRNGSCSMWFWVSVTSLNQKWISSSSINQNLPRPSHVWSWKICSWTCADSMSRTTTLLSQHVSHPPFFVLWSDPKECKNPHVRAMQPCHAQRITPVYSRRHVLLERSNSNPSKFVNRKASMSPHRQPKKTRRHTSFRLGSWRWGLRDGWRGGLREGFEGEFKGRYKAGCKLPLIPPLIPPLQSLPLSRPCNRPLSSL